MNKVKMIIDTDPGVDDAMAIFYAGLHPDIELVGLTSVFGNVDLEKTTRNALVLGDMLRQDIPVAKGAARPLVQPPNAVSDYVHGIEGFGDKAAIGTPRAPVGKSAAQFIVDAINENPNEITLVPVGPLTNIADALALDPSITTKVKEVVIMGGGLHSGGNVTPHAEANIWNDPHAADIVFAADWPLRMIGLDVTQKIVCPHEFFTDLVADAPELGGFLADITEFYIKFYREHVGVDGCQMHDPSTVQAVLFPELFEYETVSVAVTLTGEEIGATIKSSTDDRRPVRVAITVDADAIKDDFSKIIKSGY